MNMLKHVSRMYRIDLCVALFSPFCEASSASASPHSWYVAFGSFLTSKFCVSKKDIAFGTCITAILGAAWLNYCYIPKIIFNHNKKRFSSHCTEAVEALDTFNTRDLLVKPVSKQEIQSLNKTFFDCVSRNREFYAEDSLEYKKNKERLVNSYSRAISKIIRRELVRLGQESIDSELLWASEELYQAFARSWELLPYSKPWLNRLIDELRQERGAVSYETYRESLAQVIGLKTEWYKALLAEKS